MYTFSRYTAAKKYNGQKLINFIVGISYRLVYSASLISGREREISINNCSNSSELANLILILSKWIYTPVSIKSPSESYVLIENEYSLGINVIVGISIIYRTS